MVVKLNYKDWVSQRKKWHTFYGYNKIIMTNSINVARYITSYPINSHKSDPSFSQHFNNGYFLHSQETYLNISTSPNFLSFTCSYSNDVQHRPNIQHRRFDLRHRKLGPRSWPRHLLREAALRQIIFQETDGPMLERSSYDWFHRYDKFHNQKIIMHFINQFISFYIFDIDNIYDVITAKAAGVPFLPPYRNSDADFSHGVNFAVAGSTALPWYDLAAENVSSSVTNSSLFVQLDWMAAYFNSICHNPRG